MTDAVTNQMEQGLRYLQGIKGHDYGAAYWAAYGGIHGLNPRNNPFARDLIYGRSLALQLWTRRQQLRFDA